MLKLKFTLTLLVIATTVNASEPAASGYEADEGSVGGTSGVATTLTRTDTTVPLDSQGATTASFPDATMEASQASGGNAREMSLPSSMDAGDAEASGAGRGPSERAPVDGVGAARAPGGGPVARSRTEDPRIAAARRLAALAVAAREEPASLPAEF